MISIPLYPFLFAYGFFLLAAAAFFFVNIGHLVHTGTLTFASFFATFLFLAACVVVLWFTWQLTLNVNWQQMFPIWNSAWVSGNAVIPL